MLHLPNEECALHLERVREFALQVGLQEQLETGLQYLGSYATGSGGLYDHATGADTRCSLHPDYHGEEHSFEFLMECRKSESDPWQRFFIGSLIYQGPSAPADGGSPSFTVSLASGHGWFTHT